MITTRRVVRSLHSRVRSIFFVSLLALLGFSPALASAQTVEWIDQLGTSSFDSSEGVSVDGLGNVYYSGYTNGNLGGTNAGGTDAFVSKYDVSGTLLWTEQLGTNGNDRSSGVSADGLGNVYISGYTPDSLGRTSPGSKDAFVSKYDAAGTLLWTKRLGTSTWDESNGVSADGLGNVYISGFTEGSLGGTNAGNFDSFVSKYDAAGTLLWTKQLGTLAYDVSHGVSADGLGNVYISGRTGGSLVGTNAGSTDAFVSKYDAAGTLLWTKQLGTSGRDRSKSVSADGLGNVFVSGITGGILGGTSVGAGDAFVSKYDAAGTLLWTEQLGTSGTDYSHSASADGLGNVYISGSTEGSLGGTNEGDRDAFVSKYDAAGTLLWTEQFGTSSTDVIQGVSADGLGNVYFSGWTDGSLGGPNAGSFDAFVGKIHDPDAVPPTTVLLDIKPGSDSNPVNLKSKGVLPVAILSTEEFDVSDVDLESLLFGDPLLLEHGGTGVSPLRYAFEDLTDDGLLDLTLKFSMTELVDAGALGMESLEGLLTGQLLDGTRIEGLDSIRIVPSKGASGDQDLLQATAVPEPGSLLLAAFAVLGLLLRRR